jgi:hypothetical protein
MQRMPLFHFLQRLHLSDSSNPGSWQRCKNIQRMLSVGWLWIQVHNIDGKGHDNGVVYCEMQAYENTLTMLMDLGFSLTCHQNTTPVWHPNLIGYGVRFMCQAVDIEARHLVWWRSCGD